MATHKQEHLYNDIVRFYDLIDKLVASVENAEEKNLEKYFAVIEPLVTLIESSTDILTEKFLEFVKDGYSDKLSAEISQNFDKILSALIESKNDILEITSMKE